MSRLVRAHFNRRTVVIHSQRRGLLHQGHLRVDEIAGHKRRIFAFAATARALTGLFGVSDIVFAGRAFKHLEPFRHEDVAHAGAEL